MNEKYFGHLASIVAHADVAIICNALDGTIKSWNKGSEKMFGYSSKEVIGKNISLIIPPEFLDEEKDILNKIVKNKIVYNYEAVRIKKNNNQFYVSIALSPLKNEEGDLIGVSKIIRDITTQKKLEAALDIANKELADQNEEREKRAAELIIANKELAFQHEEKEKRTAELIIANKELAFQNEEKHKRAEELLMANKELDSLNKTQQVLFAAVVNSSNDAMLSKTLDGIITSWNHGAEKIFGYSAIEIIGKSVLTLIPPQLQQEEVDLTKKILAGEAVDNYKTFRTRKDGTVFTAFLTLSPIKNFEGIIIGASKILRDITEQELVEIKLSVIRKEIADYKYALDQSSIVALTDEKGIIKYVNDNFLNISKYSREELIGQDHRIISSGHHSRSFIKNLWVTTAEGKIWKGELKNKAKDGTVYWVDTTIVPFLDNEGKPYQYMAIRADITERKNTEGKIIESEKRFKSFIENSSEGIILTDEFFDVIYRSPGSQKITGNLATENTFGRNHPDDLNPLKNIHTLVLNNPDIPVPFQGRFIQESGKYIWLEGTFTNLLHVNEVNAIVANYRDITNRKKLEDLLHKANVLARVGGWEVDLLKGTVYWSDITREIHEAESSFVPDLATGINFYKEGPGRDLITQKVKEAIELRKPWDEELQIVTVKNNVRWIRTIGETEFVDGKCVRIVGSFQDIDERKKAEEKIIESENRMRLVTSSAAMGIWYWDNKNDNLVWDKKLYQIYNIKESQLGSVYEGWLARLHPEDKDRVNEVMQTAIAAKEREYSSEFRIIWSDLSLHYIKGTGITEFDDNGNVIGMMGVNWDVTAEKEKERHLKLLESVITNTTDSVLITEAEPFDEPGNKIVFVNKAFTKMTGYSLEEVIGKTPRMLQGPETDKNEMQRLGEAIRKWQPFEATVINYKKNGETFWNNFTLNPVTNEKNFYTHWIAIERDITALKLAEIELKQLNKNLQKHTKELALSNAELEQFAYVASHDLQEPLRMITSFLTQLEKNYGDVVDDKGKKYINFAVDGARRMRQIILDLLEYSKVGRIKEPDEYLDLNELIAEIKILLRNKIADKKAVIIIDQLPKVLTHRSPLYQVFLNLISNALQYSSKEIPVTIHVAVKELKNYWQFAVIDNGIGIEKEYFDKIFVIFQRLHTREEYPGNGMGLAITKKIIEAQGGKIWVESEDQKGSTFYFRIPKKK